MRFIIALLTAFLLVGCAGGNRPLLSKTRIPRDSVPVQFGFGGKEDSTISISDAQWAALRTVFTPPSIDAADERQRVRIAVAMMERIAAGQLPIGNDVGKNRMHPDGGWQLDCLDESANTSTFLLLFQQEDWLEHHVVMERAFRAPMLLDPHHTALLRERATGTRYAVDSWFLDHGEPPYVQEFSQWLSKEPFDPAMNPPLGEVTGE